MKAKSSWGMTPRQSVEQECSRRGKSEVVAGCIALLNGRDADAELIVALGGPPARWAATGEDPGPSYWLRTWAARGLLWAWDYSALPALIVALDDDAWRVREAALKVVARHKLSDATAKVIALQNDPVARVRSAASRALERLVIVA